MQNENEFPEVKTMSLLNLCRYLDRGRLAGVIEKAIQERLGDAWGLFEQLRLNHLELNPESKSAAETALARLASRAVSMLSGDNDRTGRNTIKAMRTLKLCLGILPSETDVSSDNGLAHTQSSDTDTTPGTQSAEFYRYEDGDMRGPIAHLTPRVCEQSAFVPTSNANPMEFGIGPRTKVRDCLVILAELRSRIGEYPAQVEREYIALIDELRASLDRDSVNAARRKLRDASIQEALVFIQTLLPRCAKDAPSKDAEASPKAQHAAMPAAPLELQTKKSLLDLCREFDAIDLSECNRRLEAGEKFDAACDKAMEKRIALADQLKIRLGDDWVTFEAYAEVSDPKDSAEAALWELATAIASRLSGHVADQDIELVKPQLSRLVGLFAGERL